MAEALRAYLENPNYMKSRHPAVAARLRSYVNENPRLSPHIQLNANAPTGSPPGLFAQTQDAGLLDNAVGSAGGRLAKGASSLKNASKNANLFKFSELPQRPFVADYPSDVGPIGQPLAHTMDGVPLRSEFVAGRKVVGGGDEGLGPDEIARLAARLSDDVRPALAGEIANDAGRYVRVAGEDGPETAILYRSVLDPERRTRVLAHEIGHAIDDRAGGIPVDGVIKALRANYNTGTNSARGRVPGKDLGDAATWAKAEGPQHHGYKKPEEVTAELMAEALRAYLENPNYMKSRYPAVAARLRSYVNENPRLSPHIQLNANAPDRLPSRPLCPNTIRL
jgi:hypothetical protein